MGLFVFYGILIAEGCGLPVCEIINHKSVVLQCNTATLSPREGWKRHPFLNLKGF